MRAHFGGLVRVLMWRYDATTGSMVGQSPTLAAGATSGAYVMGQARSANFAYANAVQLQQQGGDKEGNILSYSTSKLAAFDVTNDEYDTALEALIEESTANTTNTSWTKVASNPNRSAPVSMGLAIQRRGTNTDTGADLYQTVFIPRTQVTFRKPGGTFRGEGLVTLNVVPQFGSYAHTGQSYGSGGTGLNFGLTENKTDHYAYYSAYPLHVMVFRQDNSATTFTCTYRPVSTTITLNATGNELVIGGTPTALSSINTSTGVATLAAAGTSGVYDVLTYETNYVTV